MNNKIIFIIFVVVSQILGQEFDSLKLDKHFLWGPMYSIYNTSYKPVFDPFGKGNYNQSFLCLFEHNTAEYEMLNSALNKNLINTKYVSWLAGIPLGLGVANLLSTDPIWDKRNDSKLILTGIFFAGIGFYLQEQIFENVQQAVVVRNKRIINELKGKK